MKIISFKGYHGTDTESCKNILNSNYRISQGDDHWLGDGVYFFVEGISTRPIELAEKWAIAQSWDKNKKNYIYSDYSVLESMIKVEEDKFLDLTNPIGVDFLSFLANNFKEAIKIQKRNRKKVNQKDLTYDEGALINLARKVELFPFEVIKGNFYIKFKNERVNNINLRTSNCTICAVSAPQKNLTDTKEIKQGKI